MFHPGKLKRTCTISCWLLSATQVALFRRPVCRRRAAVPTRAPSHLSRSPTRRRTKRSASTATRATQNSACWESATQRRCAVPPSNAPQDREERNAAPSPLPIITDPTPVPAADAPQEERVPRRTLKAGRAHHSAVSSSLRQRQRRTGGSMKQRRDQ